MSRDRKIVGIWPANAEGPIAVPSAHGDDDVPQGAASAEPAPPLAAEAHTITAPTETGVASDAAEPEWWTVDEPVRPSRRWGMLIAGAIMLGWLLFAGWAMSSGFSTLPDMAQWPVLAAGVAAPLAVVLLIVIAVERSSAAELTRHTEALALLRREQEMMAERLAATNRQWVEAQSAIATSAQHYVNGSFDASQRLLEVSAQLDAQMGKSLALTEQMAEQGGVARRQMDGLVLALPKIEVVARRAADQMRQSGQSAYQYGGQLEAQIAAIRAEAAETEQRLNAAQDALAHRLEALRGFQDDMAAQPERLAQQFSAMLEQNRQATLTMLADFAATIETHVASIEARAATARLDLRQTVDDDVAALTSAIAQSESRAQAMQEMVRAAYGETEKLDGRLADAHDRAHGHVRGIAKSIADVTEQAAASIDTVLAVSERARTSALDNLVTTKEVGEQAERIVATLVEATRAIGVTLPDVVSRLREDVADSHDVLSSLVPLIGSNAEATEATLTRLRGAEELLEQQVATMTALDRMASATLTSQADSFSELSKAIETLSQRMATMGDSDAPAMLESLRAAQATAADIADNAQQAIAGVIDHSSRELRSSIAAAFDEAAGETAAIRIANIAETAERAVAAANAASDRLMRQLITIADSSAALEARMAEVNAAIDSSSHDGMARQVAKITESLQSTAIDMTRLLSADVADQSWELYLKGDRSIFARRGLRLLTTLEAKDVLQRYQGDDDFRLLVNRFIHDFEAMLRGLMDTRDGSALSVTLLSSDVGKMYVALAQAIERLRT